MRQFLKSFTFALAGFSYAWKHERNFRLHLIILVVVAALGLGLGFSLVSWVIILIVASFVIALELVNTALERTLDLIEPRLSDQVRIIKNILASAVTVVALIAVVIGLLLLVPYVM